MLVGTMYSILSVPANAALEVEILGKSPYSWDMRDERIHLLSRRSPPLSYSWVLYWMQASLRVEDNLALEYASELARGKSLPLLVVFGLPPGYPDAAPRHYRFLLDGLGDVAEQLKRHGTTFLLRYGEPPEVALEFAARAAVSVVDVGYTRIQKEWRRRFAERVPGPAVRVEDNVSVPVEILYPKAAVGARVIRPHLHRLREVFLRDGVEGFTAPAGGVELDVESLDPHGVELSSLSESSLPGPIKGWRGGEAAAHDTLDRFLQNGIERYADEKNDPGRCATSRLSPYLHFGHISVREVARRALTIGGEGAEAFLEELLVRRELAVNYVHYLPDYHSPAVLPRWAAASLDAHAADPRPVLYDEATMEAGETDDAYWNAAQREMVHTGYMHGYMRMYWGKKVMEWASDWRRAWGLLTSWNDTYELDGRDPNGYAGVAWCFGMHDRPWKERAVFGVVRYMNAAGLKRKFDIDRYVVEVNRRIDDFKA